MNVFKLSSITFRAEPKNYAKIDDKLSRSAQPQKEDFQWLKEQGVTDIINFRTMVVGGLDFDEETEVLKLGMKYHNIPSITNNPQLDNVNKFLSCLFANISLFPLFANYLLIIVNGMRTRVQKKGASHCSFPYHPNTGIAKRPREDEVEIQ